MDYATGLSDNKDAFYAQLAANRRTIDSMSQTARGPRPRSCPTVAPVRFGMPSIAIRLCAAPLRRETLLNWARFRPKSVFGHFRLSQTATAVLSTWVSSC